jgi:8-oxo-dGTP pyrophosphatase MutT (NUDIX family)
MKTFYVAAGGVVFDGGGRVLVLDRPSRDEVRLPKGHVERDETPLEAAVRETGEEAGYDDLALLCDLGQMTVEFDYEGQHITRDERYFAFRLASDRQAERRPKDAKQFDVTWLAP